MDYTIVENQEALKERLKNGIVLVSFTKKDGERRDMQCTLNGSHIKTPTTSATKESSRVAPSTSLAVYDVNKDAWRSFRWDSIIEVQ